MIETITITGGSGFLGQALIPYLMEKYKPRAIRLMARNDFRMAKVLRDNGDLYKYRVLRPMIGDVCDRERVFSVIEGSDLVIHAAALKRLEIANYAPQEAVKVNVMGSINVMDACLQKRIPKAIFISSDKAVNALNLYGRTKAVMESTVIERAKMIGSGFPVMCVVRYGNVLASTGAVMPYFIERAKKGEYLPITSPDMTRYLITKKDALEIVGQAIDSGKQAEVIIPKKLRAINILTAATIINDYFGGKSEIKVEGMFSGEKLHEEISEGTSSKSGRIVDRHEFIEMLREEELI